MVKPILTDQNIPAVFDNGVLSPVEGIDGAMKVIVQDSSEVATEDALTIIRTPVKDADIGANYIEGSQGMVKTIKTYKTADAPSGTALLQTYKYEDTDFPEFWTTYTETNTTI